MIGSAAPRRDIDAGVETSTRRERESRRKRKHREYDDEDYPDPQRVPRWLQSPYHLGELFSYAGPRHNDCTCSGIRGRLVQGGEGKKAAHRPRQAQPALRHPYYQEERLRPGPGALLTYARIVSTFQRLHAKIPDMHLWPAWQQQSMHGSRVCGLCVQRHGSRGALDADGLLPWTQAEDNLLCSIIHEFGTNWRLVADILSTSCAMSGIFRNSGQCCGRFQELAVRTTAP